MHLPKEYLETVHNLPLSMMDKQKQVIDLLWAMNKELRSHYDDEEARGFSDGMYEMVVNMVENLPVRP